MKLGHEYAKKEWHRIMKYAAVILPSVALGVLAMLGGMSPLLMTAGALSLALVPAFFGRYVSAGREAQRC